MSQRVTAPETWGAGVKALRTEQDLSQSELADRVGTTQTTISRVEKGSRQISDALRLRIANALGVDPYELFPYEDKAGAA